MPDKNPRPALTRKLKELDSITLIGVVEDFDDDHYSIDLEPCSAGGLIIVPKSSVEVTLQKKMECSSGESVQLSSIKAKKNTPIMKLQAATLSDAILKTPTNATPEMMNSNAANIVSARPTAAPAPAMPTSYRWMLNYTWPGPLPCGETNSGFSKEVDGPSGRGKFYNYMVLCAGLVVTIFYDDFYPIA
jgi:hypothetical protein